MQFSRFLIATTAENYISFPSMGGFQIRQGPKCNEAGAPFLGQPSAADGTQGVIMALWLGLHPSLLDWHLLDAELHEVV